MNSTAASDIETGTNDDLFPLAVIYLIVSLLVMSANAVVVLVVAKTQELHLPTLWTVTWMAVFDFFMGLYILVFIVPSAFLNRFAYSNKLISVASCLLTFMLGQTVFNVALTAMERCIAVCWPLRYVQIVTKKRFVQAVTISIFFSVLRVVLISVPDGDFYFRKGSAICVVDFDTLPNLMASVGFPIVTLCMIVICLVLIFIRKRVVKNQVRPEGLNSRPDVEVKFPLMCVISTSVFCISYVPFTVGVITNYKAGKNNVPILLVRILMTSLFSNSLWNVFIYTATYQPFREALTRLFCKSYFRKKRQQELFSGH